MLREDLVGDRAVGGAGGARVHDAQHLLRPSPPLRRDTRIRRDRFAGEGCPKSAERRQAIGRQFVESDERGERLPIVNRGQVDAVALTAQAELRWDRFMRKIGVRPDFLNSEGFAGSRCRAAAEENYGRIYLGRPGDRLRNGGDFGVGDEIATPNGKRNLSPLPKLCDRLKVIHNSQRGIRHFDGGTPRRAPPHSTDRYRHRRIQTASFLPRAFPTAFPPYL